MSVFRNANKGVADVRGAIEREATSQPRAVRVKALCAALL
ncbi:MAG: hypothetical protein RJA49_2193, partial [Actinomycetota bacterium]